MTQVGTSAFAADSPCHPTTVTLMGSADGWSASLAEPLKAYAKDLAKYSDGYQMKMEMTMGADIAAESSVTTCIRNDKALLEAVWYVFQVPTLMIPLPSKEETVCMAVLYVFDEAETEGKCTDNCQCASYRRCNGEICYLDPIDMKIQLEIQAKIKLALNPPKVEVKVPDVEIKVEPVKIEVEVPDVEIEVPEVKIEVCVPEIEIETPKIEIEVPDIEIKAEVKVEPVKIEVKLPEVKLPSVYFCNGYTNKRPMCFTAKASDDGALAEGGLSAKSFECVEPADFLTGGALTMGNLTEGNAITAKSNGAVFAGESLKMGDKVSVTYYQPIGNNNEDYRPPKPMSDADRLKFALLAAGIVEMPKIEMPKIEAPKMPKVPKIEAPKLDKQCRPILPKLEMPKLPEMPLGPDGKPMKGAFEKGGFFDTHPWFWKYKVPEKQLLPRFSPKFTVSSFAGSPDKIAPCMMLVKLTGAAQLVAGAAAVTVALF